MYVCVYIAAANATRTEAYRLNWKKKVDRSVDRYMEGLDSTSLKEIGYQDLEV